MSNGCRISQWVDHVLFTSKTFEAWIMWPLHLLCDRHWSVRAVFGLPALAWCFLAFWVVAPFIVLIGLVGGVIDVINGDI